MPKRGSKKVIFELTKRQVCAVLWGAKQIEERYPCAFNAFMLQYVLGLRIGEVPLLRYEHVGAIDQSGNIRSIRVPTLKKHKRTKEQIAAFVPKKPPVFIEVPVLAHFPWVRAAFDPKTRKGKAALSPYLFPSPQSPTKHVSERYLFEAFRAAATRGSVDRRATSHALRYAAATELGLWVKRVYGQDNLWEIMAKFLRHSAGSSDWQRGDRFAVTRQYVRRTCPITKLADWVPAITAGALRLPEPLQPMVVSIL